MEYSIDKSRRNATENSDKFQSVFKRTIEKTLSIFIQIQVSEKYIKMTLKYWNPKTKKENKYLAINALQTGKKIN